MADREALTRRISAADSLAVSEALASQDFALNIPVSPFDMLLY